MSNPGVESALATEALWAAAVLGSLGGVKDAIASGANVESRRQGRTPLQYACGDGKLEVAKALIEAGADVEAVSTRGQTALMKAAVGGHGECAKLLAGAGARIDATDSQGRHALSWAIGCHGDALPVLIVLGSHLELRDELGLTAAGLACSIGEAKAAKMLIAAGCRHELILGESKTLRDLCVDNGMDEVVELIDALAQKTMLELEARHAAGPESERGRRL